MHILLTNDDGITAPGLEALAKELQKIGRVSIVAPDRNWSASGHVKTMHRPLRAYPTQLSDETPAFASDGAPSDCVALALLGLVSDKVNLVVSGINSNANLGHDVTYSGTVTAAMEAVINGYPGIAISLGVPDGFKGKRNYAPAASIARQIIESVIQRGLSPTMLLNINIPYLPIEQVKGVLITRQGTRIYRDELIERKDPQGRPYYWLGGEAPSGLSEEGTDIGALWNGYVSITPLQLDLTSYHVLANMQAWEWNIHPESI